MTAQSPRPSFGKFKKPSGPKPEPKILYQKYFKSVGPRTYAAQVKQAANGNHFLVLTEGRRDEKTNELRMSRVFLYSEDFVEFFRMLHETAQFIKAHPLDPKIKARRDKVWAKKTENVQSAPATPAAPATRAVTMEAAAV